MFKEFVIMFIFGVVLATVAVVAVENYRASGTVRSADCWNEAGELIFSSAVDEVSLRSNYYEIRAAGVVLRTNATCVIEYAGDSDDAQDTQTKSQDVD